MATDKTMFTISDAAVHHLRAPSERVIKTSWGVMQERHAIFISLESDAGHVGWGESWVNFPVWSAKQRSIAFNEAYFPYLRGKAVTSVREFMIEMGRAFMGPAVQAGVVGATVSELCAIELALFDLEAQQGGIPLNKLWFDKPASEVTVYASGINSPLPWEEIDAMLEAGVRHFKLKVGFGEEDLPNIKALCKHLEPTGSRLAIDANRHWPIKEALRWLPILRDHGIQWLEEPLKPSDEMHYPRLLDPYVVAISAGENVWLPPGAAANTLVDIPVHILQPDITKNCSASVAIEAIGLAKQKQKPVFPHYLGSAIGQAASIHLASGCTGNQAPFIEWDINPNPLRTDLLGASFAIRNGKVQIPEQPGLAWPFALEAGE